MLKPLTTAIVTWFGAGLLPKMPGTWGSMAALPFIWYLSPNYLWGLIPLGWLATFLYIQQPGKNKDPKEVVIDEVIGQWIALVFAPKTLVGFALGFALFRLFDIWKPWPISWADSLKGSHATHATSILLDDMLAGLIAWMVLMAIS